ncbi:MAG: glyoxylate/hydroxypyruvate reductase A [Gammaproteobacteria bacterium]|nr:glyoxylate/hydroxypyruvate reductase A [Gammaproteobacteria bacterium]
MSILIIAPDRDLTAFSQRLAGLLPQQRILLWPEGQREAEVAVVWQPPVGWHQKLPRLRLIHSYGAGVEGLLADPQLPDVPLCRMVEPALAVAMARYLVGQVLADQLRLTELAAAQCQHQWIDGSPRGGRRVVILGRGAMGEPAGLLLRQLGFEVRWWRTVATANDELAGIEALQLALADCDYLINTLPLTAATDGLLNVALWQQAHGLVVINVGRGRHLVADDLLTALASGQIRRAVLDVFEQEPLPVGHPLWAHPQISISPHCSALTDPLGAAAVVADNVRRWQQGLPLCHLVDRQHGY